jgi:mannose-6-phosphate isomerase-like protein (cupin superfamily)
MPATIPSRVRSLIASIEATLAARKSTDDAVGREIQKILSLLQPLPALTGRFSKSSQAATRHIEPALRAGNESTQALLEAIGPVIRYLPWRYSYPPRDDRADLGQHIAFAEIVGPEAPFRSDHVCLGLTLIGPQTLYKMHRHPAIELYHVVAGTAAWTLDDVSRDNQPGTYVLHPSQAVHAMQTRAQPLLAIYFWSGTDVRTASVYVDSSRAEETGQAN